MRYYEIGDTSTLIAPDFNFILRNRETIVDSSEAWEECYLDICDSIRAFFQFDNTIMLALPFNKDDNKSIGVIVFDHKADGRVRKAKLDEELNKYYIEI